MEPVGTEAVMLQSLVGLGAGALALAVFIWVLPILLIARSDKTSGLEKAVWILLILFFSWFAWIFYMLLAPLEPENKP
jgi:hypothetical protein